MKEIYIDYLILCGAKYLYLFNYVKTYEVTNESYS